MAFLLREDIHTVHPEDTSGKRVFVLLFIGFNGFQSVSNNILSRKLFDLLLLFGSHESVVDIGELLHLLLVLVLLAFNYVEGIYRVFINKLGG